MTNEQYYDLRTPYNDALQIMGTRIDILDHNLYHKPSSGPVHHIQKRVKSKQSIEEKLRKLNLTDSKVNAKENLLDIAGIRVICYFTDDIYNLVEVLKGQSDLIILKEKDYIKHPKPNGYRSYHIIIGVPLYYAVATEYSLSLFKQGILPFPNLKSLVSSYLNSAPGKFPLIASIILSL